MMKIKKIVLGSINNNCYLVTDEKSGKSALVDCTLFNKEMEDFIGDADLEYILLTHGHFDHIVGAKEVKQKYGAKIVISEIDAPMLKSPRLSLSIFMKGNHKGDIDADILVKNGDAINLGDTQFKVMLTPGHTKGSVCYIADDVIFSGDTLFYHSCGRTDFPGGNFMEMQISLEKLKMLKGNYKILTGHDSETTLDDERKNNPYM